MLLSHSIRCVLVVVLSAVLTLGCGARSVKTGPRSSKDVSTAMSVSRALSSLEPPASPQLSPTHFVLDPRAEAEADASAVFRALHPDMMACYRTRLRSLPTAHGYVTLDVLVGSDGRPRRVDTTGGALLGDAVLACLVRHVMRAAFVAPRDGGTSRIRVPIAFHPGPSADEEPGGSL